MGLIVRSGIVIATIYALSPAHEQPQAPSAPSGASAMSAAARAVRTAEELCGPGLTVCVIDALQALHNARTNERALDRKSPRAAPGPPAAPARHDEN